MDDNPYDRDGDLPKLPLDPEIWMFVIAIGIFGTLQQFCLIGKRYHKLYLSRKMLHFKGAVFGRSVNPVPTRRADYAHHITTGPPDF